MPKQVLTRRRSWTARIAVLAVVFSLLAVALPASAHSVAIDTSVSCPATTPNAGFTDIGAFGADVQLAINCLFMYGITQGTTATTYSPNGTVLRWQMALFLVRQAADHGITIPAAASQGYTDIAGLPQATIDAINQVTQLGISKGTSTTTFSPNDPVTRWQMALFLRRLAGSAGVTVTDDPLHNQFTDIAAYTAEIQAAINFLADGHIALGVGGSIYDGNSNVLRWQMALFLTRVLAADGVVPPAGFRVTVTPTDAVSLSSGNARAYTATFKNADGSVYTGAVGIGVFAVTSGVIQYDGAPVAGAVFESVSDGLVAPAVPNLYPTVQGFPGSDGIVTFVVRDTAGATETVVPVAWEDLNNDDEPEISGNSAPTEPHGVGGHTTFGATPAPAAVSGSYVLDVKSKDATGDRFVGSQAAVDCDGPTGTGVAGADCTFAYDSNDLFLVDTVPTDLAGFEAALTGHATVAGCRDVVTATYASGAGSQSTFNITTDNDPCVTITDPAAGGVTVDAFTYTIKGTGVAGYTVRVYDDANNDGVSDGTVAGTSTVAADGTWSVVVNLTQGAANNFLATQRPTPTGTDGPLVDVPTITEGAGGVSFSNTDSANGVGSASGVLDPGDTITIDFTGNITGVGSGDTLTIVDPDGSTGTLTLSAAGNASFAVGDGPGSTGTSDRLTLTITQVVTTSGGTTGGINGSGTFTAVSGFTAADGVAISMSGDRTFTTP